MFNVNNEITFLIIKNKELTMREYVIDMLLNCNWCLPFHEIYDISFVFKIIITTTLHFYTKNKIIAQKYPQ